MPDGVSLCAPLGAVLWEPQPCLQLQETVNIFVLSQNQEGFVCREYMIRFGQWIQHIPPFGGQDAHVMLLPDIDLDDGFAHPGSRTGVS